MQSECEKYYVIDRMFRLSQRKRGDSLINPFIDAIKVIMNALQWELNTTLQRTMFMIICYTMLIYLNIVLYIKYCIKILYTFDC